MPNRNKKVTVRLSDNEYNQLKINIKKTGLSLEAYLRTLINGKRPVEIPPADYYALIREVRALGNNLHQIAYKANALGFLDAPEYRRHADQITVVADKLTAVCLPRDG